MTLQFARATRAFVLALGTFSASLVAAQTPPTQAPATPAPTPAVTRCPAPPGVGPPANSGPVVCVIELRFEPINESLIEPQTYLYYIQTQSSRASDGVWSPYNEQTEQSLVEDFRRLWATNF